MIFIEPAFPSSPLPTEFGFVSQKNIHFAAPLLWPTLLPSAVWNAGENGGKQILPKEPKEPNSGALAQFQDGHSLFGLLFGEALYYSIFSFWELLPFQF
jgi:hypothetical protein